jgi:inner membrane protein
MAAWTQWLGMAALHDAYRPMAQAEWQRHLLFGETSDDNATVREVWRHPLMGRFRRFARLPALYRIDESPGRSCVWFTDLRFALPSLEPAFRYGLCRTDRESPWRLYRLRRFSRDGSEAL